MVQYQQRYFSFTALLPQDTVHCLGALAAHMVGHPYHVEIELFDHAENIIKVVLSRP